MDNQIGKNVKSYRNVTIRSSSIGDESLIGDDTFITDSNVGVFCMLERRCMIFSSDIGEYSSIGVGAMIRYARIGKFCSFAWNVTLGGAEHDYKKTSISSFPYDKFFGFVDEGNLESWYGKELNIGNDVWIGCNAVVLRGVTIGDGAIIAAGAVVTHDVGPYEIWAGVPAKKIGERFPQEIKTKLLKLKWWDLPANVIKENISFFKENVSLKTIEELEKKIASSTYI